MKSLVRGCTRHLLSALSLSALVALLALDAGSAAAADGWTNVTSNLANMQSECGNLTMLSSVPGSNTVIAGVAQHGLWASSDGGAKWQQLGTGQGSAPVTNRPSWISYDPSNPAHFYESGIYNGAGAFATINAGSTFAQLGNITHSDFVSVDYTDPDRKTLLAGGHEQGRTVWRSTDAGKSWTNVGVNLPGTGSSTNPLVIDARHTWSTTSVREFSEARMLVPHGPECPISVQTGRPSSRRMAAFTGEPVMVWRNHRTTAQPGHAWALVS